MAQRSLPGLGLTGYWPLGYSPWKDENDANLRLLSSVTQLSVLTRSTALPATGIAGAVYIVPSSDATNPNKLALWDGDAGAESWVYIPPMVGWRAYVQSDAGVYLYDGTDWVSESELVSLGELSDVDLATTPPASGNVLTFVDTLGWVPAAPSGGGAVKATTGQVLAGADDVYVAPAGIDSANALVVLSDAVSTVPVDLGSGRNFSLTLTTNVSLAAPTNAVVGRSGTFQIVQDAVGSRTLTWDAAYKFSGGSAPVLSTVGASRDFFSYMVAGTGYVVVSHVGAFA